VSRSGQGASRAGESAGTATKGTPVNPQSLTDSAVLASLRALQARLENEVSGEAADLLARLESEVRRLAQEHHEAVAELESERAARVQTEEKFAKAFHASPLSMSIATLREGRFIEVNDAFLKRLGYTRDEVIGRTSSDLRLFSEPEGREWLLESLRSHGHLNGREVRTTRKDGAIRYARVYTDYITVDGEPCILGVAEPLEERLRAEEEILRLKRFYDQVLNDLPAEVAVFDTQGHYLYLTPSAVPDAEMREWLLNKTDYEYCALLGMDVAVAYRRHSWLTQTIAGKALGRFEETCAGPNGEVKHFIRLYNPVLDAAGEVSYVISYGIDVTDLKRLEEQFSQAQKMEAVGRLAGGIAHDFNNLLTAIIGTTDLLLGDVVDEGSVRSGLEEIKRAAERAASLTRQLLAFSRRQVVQPSVINLNTVLSEMQGILRRLIGEHIELLTELDPALSCIKADATQIEQVVMNLAVNARDAMPEGGTLTLRTANVTPPAGEVPAPLALEPPPYVMLEVRDTGCGMTDEVKSHLFEPFFTTKEEGRGTGLGLSTVYAIVDRASGQIAVESEAGQGAAFRIYFPRTAQAAPAVVPSVGVAPERNDAETVLLVEDEDAVRNVVKRILEMNGFHVLIASDGVEALDVAEKADRPIRLLLSDVVMPRMSGRELAERLKQIRPDIHVLFMSGHTDDVTVHHVAVHKRMAFIQKPFSATALARKIREVLGKPSE
jgi:two-component system cell cycle sensor histidine kinase/response regulator CckA